MPYMAGLRLMRKALMPTRIRYMELKDHQNLRIHIQAL
jgi:hypothetical protein